MRSRAIERYTIFHPNGSRQSLGGKLTETMAKQLKNRNLWSPRLREHYRETREELLKAGYPAVFPEDPATDDGAALVEYLHQWCPPDSRPRAAERFLHLRNRRRRANWGRFSRLVRAGSQLHYANVLLRIANQIERELGRIPWSDLSPAQQLLSLLGMPRTYSFKPGATAASASLSLNPNRHLRLTEVGPQLLAVECH